MMTDSRDPRRQGRLIVTSHKMLLLAIISVCWLGVIWFLTTTMNHRYCIDNFQTVPTRDKAYNSCTYQGQVMPQSPTFIIAGAQKAGTSSLAAYLANHPQILGHAHLEGHFFDGNYYSINVQESTKNTSCFLQQQYLKSLFPQPQKFQQLLQNHALHSFETTPAYLYNFDTPVLLKKICPWIPKVIIMLRNPVDRAYSDYLNSRARTDVKRRITFERVVRMELHELEEWKMIRRINEEGGGGGAATKPSIGGVDKDPLTLRYEPVDPSEWTEPPGVCLQDIHRETLSKGMYAPQLQNWLDHYPRESILVLNYNDLQSDTLAVYHRILEFAGILPDPAEPPPEELERQFHKTSLAHDHDKPLSNHTRALLERFFAPWNAQLVNILGDEWEGVWAPDWDSKNSTDETVQ